jgi:hypothetical protein
MAVKKFPNIVGCSPDKASLIIEPTLNLLQIPFFYRIEIYNKIKGSSAQKKNEIVLYVDKNNEIVTTPYVIYDEVYTYSEYQDDNFYF